MENKPIRLTPNIVLAPLALSHAPALLQAVDDNRDHLSAFLPWVGQMQTVEHFTHYIQFCNDLSAQQKEVSFIIFFNDKLVGRIGLHYINQQNKSAAIGYWLIKEAEGKGIITQSCIAVINLGFKDLKLQRIELKAAVTNYKSLAIPQRLGFTKEGILRQAELVNNKFLDLVLFSLLKEDWQVNPLF
jgi:ribosomal-protein-serine acetyltransferase